jgi:tryptophanyl-tRNA synthetase
MGNQKALQKRLAKFATDPKRVTREDAGSPDDCPTIAVMHRELSSPEVNAWVRQGCTTAGIGCGDCKAKLAEVMHAHFAPYVQRRAELVADPKRVEKILADGAEKARAIARATMTEVRQKLGLWRPSL